MRTRTRLIQVLGLLLIVLTGVLYANHLLDRAPWITAGLTTVGLLIVVPATWLLRTASDR